MSSEKSVNVAIAGASGAVGEALIDILQERKFPVGELALLASSRSEGKRIQFNGKSVQIQRLDAFDFSKTQIGLFSAGGLVSAEFAPKAAAILQKYALFYKNITGLATGLMQRALCVTIHKALLF